MFAIIERQLLPSFNFNRKKSWLQYVAVFVNDRLYEFYVRGTLGPTYFKSFVIATALLFTSTYDVYTDYNLTYHYFMGDTYIFFYRNDSEFDTSRMNCTFLGTIKDK